VLRVVVVVVMVVEVVDVAIGKSPQVRGGGGGEEIIYSLTTNTKFLDHQLWFSLLLYLRHLCWLLKLSLWLKQKKLLNHLVLLR
jgi:hypothetical protein